MSQLLSILLFSLLQLAGIADEEIEFLFVGDAMQHQPQINAATRADGSLDYSQCFTMIENDIMGADFAVANLEVPLAGKPYAGYPVFSGPDEFARQLKDSGFDLLLTANMTQIIATVIKVRGRFRRIMLTIQVTMVTRELSSWGRLWLIS